MSEIDRRHVTAVINAYGAILENPSPPPRDVRELAPLTKELIKSALLTALSLTDSSEQREQLRTGVVLLADFQPMTEDERSAVSKWHETMKFGASGVLPTEIAAKDIDECGEVFVRLMKKVSEEGEALYSELGTAGHNR